MLPTTIKQLDQLPQWSMITVTGPDAAEFLQNQITNSVKSLKVHTLDEVVLETGNCFAGYCSAKGRLMGSFWIHRTEALTEGGELTPQFQLFISKDIAGLIAKRLSMFVLRSKVKVLDQSDQVLIYGLSYDLGSLATTSLPMDISQVTGSRVVEIPPALIESRFVQRFIVAIPLDQETQIQALAKEQQLLNTTPIWNWLEVMSAIPRITLNTSEQFVPQMINMESLKGIDFQKGCYPGQEVVARSQYRGTIKRRLQIASIQASTLTEPGIEIFHDADPEQPCGMVVLAAQNPANPDQLDLQVECKLEALSSGAIHLGSISGPKLSFKPLPYPLIEI
jgi:folate-binding protein YgfZ